ncbi:MAG: nucleotidyltransferase domain-containing protein, partial [Bacteroidetes bacterium]|nr:nucleotidyltransferase domain-containing protein [Bacteroidota bacterium]
MRVAKLLDKRFDMSGVSIVYLFGSRAEKKSNAMSDIDIGVVFKDEPRDEEVPRLYTELYDILTDHFPNFQIDLVFLQKANLELRFDAISHGRVLFESSQAMRLDFEENTMMLYADFRPLLEEID